MFDIVYIWLLYVNRARFVEKSYESMNVFIYYKTR